MQPDVKAYFIAQMSCCAFHKDNLWEAQADVRLHRESGWLSCLICVSVHKQLHEGALIAPRNGVLHGLEF